MADRPFEFVAPSEAPVFNPTWEEFKNPLIYIEKIKPIAERTGICKIVPPPKWKPPFSVDQEHFKFIPRLQRLNELEAKTRVRLNFLEHLSKFWDLQGTTLKIPTIDKKYLDLYQLQKIVKYEGGYSEVCKEKKWAKVASCVGLPAYVQNRCTAVIVSHHYRNIIHPYDLFSEGNKEDMAEMADINMMLKFEDAKNAALNGGAGGANTSTAGKPNGMKRGTSSKLESCSNKTTELPKVEIKQEVEKDENKKMKVDVDVKVAVKKDVKLEDIKVEVKEKQQKQSDEDGTKETDKVKKRGCLELSKLEFKGAGPKNIIQGGESRQCKPKVVLSPEIEKPSKRVTRDQKAVQYNANVEMYHCQGCASGDSEDLMLLCDGCDDAFHIYCLQPPLSAVPKGDWRCPCCVSKLCSKPSDSYGFEQSTRQYTLKTFGEMADRFKLDYFNQPTHTVPTSKVESEFWRLVNSTDDEVVVKYGADVHSMDQGSGFPMKGEDGKEVTEYMESGWNLNNLPILKQSMLQHITADISGMKIPWCYVGMCFSCFCWHTEDHWSYSINYIHWGEPKTWYGVPGNKAELFEECIRYSAPELFEQSPDLLHQLTTTMNPNQIQTFGVPIVRTDQNAGEFVVTFPRSYHAGFNQGFNFAEAVNFCPADWLPFGRACVQHYQEIRRQCVFSHEELICKMAIEADKLELKIAESVYSDMLIMIEKERKQRLDINKKGLKNAAREVFELMADDERQCVYCKTTIFISAVSCRCTRNIACIMHGDKLCGCSMSDKFLRYRYSLDELPEMLKKLRIRADAYRDWKCKVEEALNKPTGKKLDIKDFRMMQVDITRNGFHKYSKTELMCTLEILIADTKKISVIAQKILSPRVITRRDKCNRKARDKENSISKMSVVQFKGFIDQVYQLPCVIPEHDKLNMLMKKITDFQEEAILVVKSDTANILKIEQLIDFADTLDVYLPEAIKLREVHEQFLWLNRVNEKLSTSFSDELDKMVIPPGQGHLKLDDYLMMIDSGAKAFASTVSSAVCERTMSTVKSIYQKSEKCEKESKIALNIRPRMTMADLKKIIQQAMALPFSCMPNVAELHGHIQDAEDWIEQFKQIVCNKLKDKNPYLQTLENMAVNAKDICVQLQNVDEIKYHIVLARMWKDRAVRTFVKKNSSLSLVDVLCPRQDIGQNAAIRQRKNRKLTKGEKQDLNINSLLRKANDDLDLEQVVKSYHEAKQAEIDCMNDVRIANYERQRAFNDAQGVASGSVADTKFCLCRRVISGTMLQCVLCNDCYHENCVPITTHVGNQLLRYAGTVKPGQVKVINDIYYLCPRCHRSRRPKLETILMLLVSLSKLPVRIQEGEALQCLTEKGIHWQNRAKAVLQTEDVSILENFIVAVNKSKKKKKEEEEELLNNQTAAATTSAMANTKADASSNLTSPSEHAYSTGAKVNPSKTLNPENFSMPQLPAMVRAHLEEILMEGELFEMSFDETIRIWRILIASEETIREDLNQQHTSNANHMAKHTSASNSVDKPRKYKKKVKPAVDDSNSITSSGQGDQAEQTFATSTSSTSVDKQQGEPSTSTKERKKYKLKSLVNKTNLAVKGLLKETRKYNKQPKQVDLSGEPIAKKSKAGRRKTKENTSSSEDCQAKKCLRPIGVNIEWIQCDDCMKWYHWECVGLTADDVKKDTHTCDSCETAKSAAKSGKHSADYEDDEDDMDVEEVGGGAATTAGSPLATPLTATASHLKQDEHYEVDIDGDSSYHMTTTSTAAAVHSTPGGATSRLQSTTYEEMIVQPVVGSESIVVIPAQNSQICSSMANPPVNVEILECHEEMIPEVEEEEEEIRQQQQQRRVEHREQSVTTVTSVNIDFTKSTLE